MKSFFETGFKLKTYIKLSVKSILAYLGVNKNGIAEQTYENNIWIKLTFVRLVQNVRAAVTCQLLKCRIFSFAFLFLIIIGKWKTF